MAITDAFCTAAKELCLSMFSGDTWKVALYNSSATLGAGTTAYTSTNEVTGTNWPAGGVDLSGFSVSSTGTTAHLSFSDPSVANVTITGAVGFMIYNATRANTAFHVGNFTNGTLAATNGTVTLDLPAAGASALLRIA